MKESAKTAIDILGHALREEKIEYRYDREEDGYLIDASQLHESFGLDCGLPYPKDEGEDRFNSYILVDEDEEGMSVKAVFFADLTEGLALREKVGLKVIERCVRPFEMEVTKLGSNAFGLNNIVEECSDILIPVVIMCEVRDVVTRTFNWFVNTPLVSERDFEAVLSVFVDKIKNGITIEAEG